MNKPRPCPACRKAEMQPATYVREFHPRDRKVTVELLTSRCPACGAEATSAAQHVENLARLKARKDQYDGLLMGEEILALRRRFGITQQQAAKLFGKGKIAFSRYENEATYPDETMTLVLKLAIEKLDVVRWLAERAGIELPFLDARCEDERKQKLRVFRNDARATRWLKIASTEKAQRAVDSDLVRWWEGGSQDHSLEAAPANDDRCEMAREQYA
ncbi:MAG: type II toxin-antitoxin system MqsA family antitoxin [Proteobacteria bacterium]|nr:type II toxin-antitoxin system MqsA family antitoxin [Pseudomonadota bacterium]